MKAVFSIIPDLDSEVANMVGLTAICAAGLASCALVGEYCPGIVDASVQFAHQLKTSAELLTALLIENLRGGIDISSVDLSHLNIPVR